MRGWRRVLRVGAWVAVGVVMGAIALSVALAFVAGGLGSGAEGAAYVVGMLVGVPAFLLLVPVLIVAAGVEYSLNRGYRGKPIVASWDVSLAGERHVVSLPASRISAADHVWVDGVRMPVAWTPTGVWSARAAVDGGTFRGRLSRGTDTRGAAATAGFLAASAALGAPVAGGPRARYALQVEGATVEAVPVADGERRS